MSVIGYASAKQLANTLRYSDDKKKSEAYRVGMRLGGQLALNSKRYTKQQIIKMAKSIKPLGSKLDRVSYQVAFLYEYVDMSIGAGKMEPSQEVNLFDFYEMGVISATQAGVELKEKN